MITSTGSSSAKALRSFWILLVVAVLAAGSLRAALTAGPSPLTGLRMAGSGLVLLVAVALAGRVVVPAAAAADFGQHVRTCAQTMGFDGEHNPGMHNGFRGWNPDHTC